jgi:hypothetical protein
MIMPAAAFNFSFLAVEWPQLHAEAARAEQAAQGDPRTACFYARRTLELAVAWIFQVDRGLKQPYKADLAAFLFEPTFKTLVGPALHAKMDIVRRQGNLAVHSSRAVSAHDAAGALRELFHIMFWLARQSGRSAAAQPAPGLQFRAEPGRQRFQGPSARSVAGESCDGARRSGASVCLHLPDDDGPYRPGPGRAPTIRHWTLRSRHHRRGAPLGVPEVPRHLRVFRCAARRPDGHA